MQKKKALFLCIGNSCRSQIAEGIANHYFEDKVEARSAGSNPGLEVNRLAIEAMKEIGIDISKQYPKPVETFKDMKFDYVITVCGVTPGEIQCPFFPGGEQLHWPFPDPAFFPGTPEEKLAEFRRIRDEIKRKILELLK